MTYPSIETFINESVDDNTKTILQKYWQFDNEMFISNVTQIKKEYNITQHQLNNFVQYSTSFILFGDCMECIELIKLPVKNRTEVSQKLDNPYYHFFCIDCREKEKLKLKGLSEDEIKKSKMLRSYNYKLWERLNDFELAILKEVIRLNTWNEIFNKLVKLNFQIAYEVLEKLNKIHLIDIYRDIVSKKIKEVYFLPELANDLSISQNILATHNRIGKAKHISEVLKKANIKTYK